MKATGLNPLQALVLVAAMGAVLGRDGDGLNISWRMEEVPELLDALRANKAALLAILPGQSGGLSCKS
ncbi:hypothetical protein AB4076_01405 [Dyella sp. 2RAF44]|uniref:hypothetical protein n=1 Tax=Dyella sp. 2RAF44 TaxID=3233000 RepID=UPI003F917131